MLNHDLFIELVRLVPGSIPIIIKVLVTLEEQLFSSNLFLLKHYGLNGLGLIIFGSKDILRLELQVLASGEDKDALDFKTATQDESSMIAVASTIVAQIAVTALSLMDLSKSHWTARALFSFSLVSSLVAVYYASSQYRVMGRCLTGSQIRAWIENSTGEIIIPNERKPAASSILTISGPVMLLSASLYSFLAGYGVYLGMTFTKSLDGNAEPGGSRSVFIVYIVGLVVCYGIFAFSGLISRAGATNGFELVELFEIANQQSQSGKMGTPMAERRPQTVGEQSKVGMASSTVTEDDLVRALHEAAKLREESAEADRRVADIYRALSQQLPSNGS